MKKRFYTLITIAFIAMITSSCKKEEEVAYTVGIDQISLTMFLGGQEQLDATVYPMDDKSHVIKWSSSDPSVASVTADGVVTAEGIGYATITAESENGCGRCDVAVVREGDYTMRVSLTKSDKENIKKIIVSMPMPYTNEYQDISNLYGPFGEYIETGNGNYAFYNLTHQYFDGMSMIQTFDFTPKEVNIDFSKTPAEPNICGSIPPVCFLGSEGDYIQTGNRKINAMGDSIWDLSTSEIDYARRCYEYLATKYHHVSGYFNTLGRVLQGDEATSGDFASLFVSLMRYKEIPSRHVIAMSTKGSAHTFADFYDEEYGWIPVDVDHKSRYPENDYFGKYDKGLIVENLGLVTIARDGIDLKYYPFQKYILYYWFDPSGEDAGSIGSDFTVEGKGR